jgi:ferric iron reductase protein FhuF
MHRRYDVSGVAPDKIQRVLEQDWIHLIRDKRVLDSPNYLKEKGKPVVSLWGKLYLFLGLIHLLITPIMQALGLRTETINQPSSVP